MVTLHNHVSSFPSTLFEFWASKEGRFAWFLCTHHPEKDHWLEEIQTQIKLEILSSDIQTVSKVNIESWLRNFFADLHWKLHAQFRKSTLQEKGISLWFGVLYDHELLFVQFGRLVTASAEQKKIIPIGRNWKNYHIHTLEDMSLLGCSEHDIKFKINRKFISEFERIIVLPAALANRHFQADTDPSVIDTVFENHKLEENPVWFSLKANQRLVLPRRRHSRRLIVSTVLLFLMTIISIFYMVFGNRFIDRYARKLRGMFLSKRIATLELIPQFLNQETSNMLKDIERIVVSPAQDIQLKLRWTTDLPYRVTCSPAFSYDNIYLASGKSLVAYKKKSREVLWKTSLDSDIIDMSVINQILVVILDNYSVLAFKANGQKVWTKTLSNPPLTTGNFNSLELSNQDDPALDGSVVILADNKGLYVLSAVSGTDFTRLAFKNKIQFLSNYDNFDRCFYAVVDQDIHCVELLIKN